MWHSASKVMLHAFHVSRYLGQISTMIPCRNENRGVLGRTLLSLNFEYIFTSNRHIGGGINTLPDHISRNFQGVPWPSRELIKDVCNNQQFHFFLLMRNNLNVKWSRLSRPLHVRHSQVDSMILTSLMIILKYFASEIR